MENKYEILAADNAKEVFEWMKSHLEETDAEVAAHFNFLARKEYRERHPDTDVIYDPNRRMK